METADKIVERLPGFYRARERTSYVYSLIEAIAKIIHQQRQDLALVGDSHWLESARGINLDLLASILGLGRKPRESDEEYRSRIKSSIANLRKGGTVEAVKTQLAAYLGAQMEDIVLVENPATEMHEERTVVSGDRWNMSSSSIYDESAKLIITLEDGEAKDPTITNLESKLAVKFNGTLKKGDVLEIHQGKAMLDGIDSAAVSFEYGEQAAFKENDMPVIPRKPSEWVFREKLTDTLGRFDQSKFDENIFFKPVPPTKITFRWTARLLAAFEVKVSSKVLEKSNLTKQELELLVNAIKAAGIRTTVTIMPESDEMSVVEKMPERSKPARGAGRTARQ